MSSLTPLSNSISLNCLCRSSSDFPALSCTAFFSASATSVNWECTSTMGAPLTLSCKSDDSMDLVSPSPSPSESESLLGLFAAGSVFISPVRSARNKKFRIIFPTYSALSSPLSSLPHTYSFPEVHPQFSKLEDCRLTPREGSIQTHGWRR